MNEIWNTVEPYIMTIVGALGGGSIIAVIARIICGRIINKASSAYDLNALADKIADKLGGKTIDIDISSLVEKRLEEISKRLADKVSVVATETNSYKHLLALIGEALTHLKMLTDDERSELVKAVQELDGQFVPPEKEVIATVKLEPIQATEIPEPETPGKADKATDTINLI